MADESAKNHNRNRKKFVDLGKISTKNNNNKKDLDTIILIIKFKAENHFTVHTITNYLLFSQLTYATLPECGFEWNMNDIIMKLNDKQENWLTLLIIISIGSQLLINFENLGWKNFSSLIKQYSITSILMNSNHLIDLIKEDNQLDHNSLHSIEKILYYNQIYHSNFIFKFMKNRFKNLRQCRFFLYSLETSGVIAIELTRHHYHQLGKQDAQMSLTTATTSSIEPWPSIKIQLLNWNQGNSIIHSDDFNQPGYLYVHYADEFEDNDEISGRSSEFKFNDKNWIQTNYVGYYDNEKNLQIIDRNENILTINERKYSKTIIETIMMANNLIQIKNCSINQLINDENNDKSILIEIQLNDNVISHENKIDEKILRHQLIDNFNFTDQIVDKFKFKFT